MLLRIVQRVVILNDRVGVKAVRFQSIRAAVRERLHEIVGLCIEVCGRSQVEKISKEQEEGNLLGVCRHSPTDSAPKLHV